MFIGVEFTTLSGFNPLGRTAHTQIRMVCKTATCEYVNIFVSQVVHSGITLRLHVNQFVTTGGALMHSSMMMQLCRHNGKVKNLQWCT
jgi:hypothetical protein